MKKFILSTLLFAIAIFAFFHSEPSSAAIAGLPLLANLGEAEKQDLFMQIAETMRRDNPGQEIYFGQNDMSVSFHGTDVTSFLNEINSTAQFALRLTNTSDNVIKVVLCPAYFSTFGQVKANINTPTVTTTTLTVEGTTYTVFSAYTPGTTPVVIGYTMYDPTLIKQKIADVDAVIGDGTIYTSGETSVTCATLSEGKIIDFLNYCRYNPTRIINMDIAATNVKQYSRNIQIKKMSPHKDWGEYAKINLLQYFSTMQERDEYIKVDTAKYNMQFDDQTVVIFELEGKGSGSSNVVDITFTLGGAVNNANWLANKAMVALNTISKAASNLFKK